MQLRTPLAGTIRRIFNVALGVAAAGCVVATPSLASAQSFPFPSTNVQAGAGRVVTPVLTSHEIRAEYEEWVSSLIRACPGRGSRMIYPETNNDTRSEGVGYGMVIAAYMGDQATFDGLWDFYQSHSNQGLMDWLINDCDNVGDGGSAADADIDAAFGLIVADRQWGGYQGDASAILQQVRARLFNGQCGGILLAGSNFANCGCVNPSYIPPGYYRAFAEYDDAAFWTGARDNTYAYLDNAQDPSTGLVPAWSNSTGGTNLSNCNPQVAGGGQTNEFQADAARTPWRVAADLLWTGEPRAAGFLSPIASFAASPPNRITHIVDRYQLGGAPLPPGNLGNNPLDPATLDATERRSSFTMGGFATAMTASTQENIDRFTGAWQSLYVAGDSFDVYRAFNNSLSLLYGLTVTGFMWDPVGADPVPVTEPPLNPQGANLVVNGDFDEGLLGWRFENPGRAEGEGFAMHRDGETRVVVEKITGQPDEQYMVRIGQPITLQANQNYRVSVRARAASPRVIRMFVGQRDEPYAVYLSLDDDPETEGASINLTTEMQTFEVIQQAPAVSGELQVALDFADDLAEVVIDDVSVEPTDLPVTEPGAPIAVPPPAAPGAGAPPAAGGDLGTLNPGGDATGTPGTTPVGAPNPGEATGGLPPTPAGPAPAAQCSVAADPACLGYPCSVELGLCYDPATGYVGNAGAWTQPPRGVLGCGFDQVYWPLFGACYIPETGWIYNQQAGQWQWYGVNYTEGERPPADSSGCALGSAPATRGGASWMLVGLLGAALGLRSRRRSA